MAFMYVHEKTVNAAQALAGVDAPLDERLAYAFEAGLMRLHGEFDDDSHDLEDQWRSILDTATTTEAETDKLKAAINEMGEDGRHDLAQAIMEFYGAVEREWGRREAAGTEFD